MLRAFREIFFSDVIKDLNALGNAHTFSQHYFRHKKNLAGYNLISEDILSILSRLQSFPKFVEMILLRISSDRRLEPQKRARNTAPKLIETL